MAQMAMVIDLQKCVSCGACALGCKTENNTANNDGKSTFNWADFITVTEGKFPDTKFISIPVLCNHCSDAPCVTACPVTPKAMFKSENGLTLHNDDRCIGCRRCMEACPYSALDVTAEGALYSVISFNPPGPDSNPYYRNQVSVISGGTSSPAEIAAKTGGAPPDRNQYTHPDYRDVRPPNVTEKCILCDHRLKQNEQPHCVTSCPSTARIVGDIDDPQSEVSKLIKKYPYFRLKNNKGEILQPGEKGTSPNVYYIRRFENLVTSTKEKPTRKADKDFIKLYPNPASDQTSLEIEVESGDYLDCAVYSISGQLVDIPAKREFKTPGTHTIGIKLNALPSGTYIVQVALGNQRNTKQLIVQK